MKRCLAVLASLVLFSSCGARKMVASYEVPRPGPITPYGLLLVEVEAGDTRRPALKLVQAGYQDRKVDVPGNGVVVVRVNAGDWEVQITGSPAPGDVITFSGSQAGGDGDASRPRGWPEKPYEVRVRPGMLTNGGHLCAHRGCKTVWESFEHPKLEAWREARRYLESKGPAR